MTGIPIIMSKEEFNLVKAALAHYRLAGFPLGKSSYGNPISFRDRREWAAFGMKVWDRFFNPSKAETPG